MGPTRLGIAPGVSPGHSGRLDDAGLVKALGSIAER
jgi:hypothetical protein